MNKQRNCEQCGRPLTPGTTHGLCPACLLKRGLESNTIDATAGESSARWSPPPIEDIAEHFPELDILELIGRGGMGAVYKARQKELDRTVALKILPPGIGQRESFTKRFTREAQAMAKLGHANIVTIHSFGRRGELYFFLMEYVDGLSLRQVLNSGGVGATEALAIVPQICDALQYAHDRGIVHRDIKPENILMDREGQVKIADFGLAKLVGLAGSDTADADAGSPGDPGSPRRSPTEPDVTQADKKVMGTPQYMAPEQIDSPAEVDHRADIYSLGVVFYQMLTGELPAGSFSPPSHKVLIDVRLDEVVLRAMEREPTRRYQQASEVRTQVETIAAATTTASERSVGTARPAPHELEESELIDRARRAVKIPAIGLIVTALVSLKSLVTGILLLILTPELSSQQPIILGRFMGILHTSSPPRIQVTLLLLASNFIMLAGAIQMLRLRNRGLAIGAAVWVIAKVLIAAPTYVFVFSLTMTTMTGLSMLGHIIGLPIGIWALVVLSRRDIRQAFAVIKTPEDEADGQPRKSVVNIDANLKFGSRSQWKCKKRIPIVGVRDGKRVVCWLGVMLVSVLIFAGALAGCFLLDMVLHRFVDGSTPIWLLLAIASGGTAILTLSAILRGLSTPLDRLTPLDSSSGRPAWHRWVAAVGTRSGQPMVNWPGCITFASVLFGVCVVPACAFNPWPVSMWNILLSAMIAVSPVLLAIWIGMTGRMPPHRLVSLDDPSWPRWAGALCIVGFVWLAVLFAFPQTYEPDHPWHDIPQLGLIGIGVVALAIAFLGWLRTKCCHGKILALVALTVCLQMWASVTLPDLREGTKGLVHPLVYSQAGAASEVAPMEMADEFVSALKSKDTPRILWLLGDDFGGDRQELLKLVSVLDFTAAKILASQSFEDEQRIAYYPVLTIASQKPYHLGLKLRRKAQGDWILHDVVFFQMEKSARRFVAEIDGPPSPTPMTQPTR